MNTPKNVKSVKKINTKELNKSIQFLTKVSQPQLNPATIDQQLFSVFPNFSQKLISS